MYTNKIIIFRPPDFAEWYVLSRMIYRSCFDVLFTFCVSHTTGNLNRIPSTLPPPVVIGQLASLNHLPISPVTWSPRATVHITVRWHTSPHYNTAPLLRYQTTYWYAKVETLQAEMDRQTCFLAYCYKPDIALIPVQFICLFVQRMKSTTEALKTPTLQQSLCGHQSRFHTIIWKNYRIRCHLGICSFKSIVRPIDC